jgi:ATP-binding cassette subfamily C protein LapB
MAETTTTPDPRGWLDDIVKPLRPVFAEVMAISFFVNLLALGAPVFTLQVYDRVVYSGGLTTLQGLVIGMLILAVFDFVLRQTRARVMQTVALKVDVEVGRRLFEKLTALPLRHLETRPAAYWQALFRDVETVRNTLSGASALLVADLPFAFLFLSLIFIIATPLAWVLMAAMPFFLFLAWRSGSAQNTAAGKEKRTLISRDTLIAEMIAGRATIKALALDSAIRPIWEEKTATSIEDSAARGSTSDGFVNMTASLTMLINVTMTTVGALFIVDQKLTVGSLVASNMLMGKLLSPLNQLVGTWKTYAAFRQSVERLSDMFAAPQELRESGIKHEKPKGNLATEEVTFRYAKGAAPTLDTISLAFGPGVTAIIGPNGCGKTTLIKALMGLYAPDSGRVTLDGADIAQFTRRELADWMGYCPQECVLFSGTIRDNIAHGGVGVSDEDIINAARLAGVHQTIIDLPDGYGTPVGEGGNVLSGGQRQRIVMARALVGDPPVLILDEPSSNLDRKAEEDLARTLSDLGKTHSVIMVTHSPVLLAACQQVVALDRGRVVSQGHPADLLPRLFGRSAPNRPTVAVPAPAGGLSGRPEVAVPPPANVPMPPPLNAANAPLRAVSPFPPPPQPFAPPPQPMASPRPAAMAVPPVPQTDGSSRDFASRPPPTPPTGFGPISVTNLGGVPLAVVPPAGAATAGPAGIAENVVTMPNLAAATAPPKKEAAS